MKKFVSIAAFLILTASTALADEYIVEQKPMSKPSGIKDIFEKAEVGSSYIPDSYSTPGIAYSRPEHEKTYGQHECEDGAFGRKFEYSLSKDTDGSFSVKCTITTPAPIPPRVVR